MRRRDGEVIRHETTRGNELRRSGSTTSRLSRIICQVISRVKCSRPQLGRRVVKGKGLVMRADEVSEGQHRHGFARSAWQR